MKKLPKKVRQKDKEMESRTKKVRQIRENRINKLKKKGAQVKDMNFQIEWYPTYGWK